MSPVEAFATGIKMESSNQGHFTRQSSNQSCFTISILQVHVSLILVQMEERVVRRAQATIHVFVLLVLLV